MAFPFGFWMLTTFVFAGIGMDTCVIPLRHGGLSLVQTTDYIYPIVDDPYMMVSLTRVCVYIWNCLLVGFGAGDLAFLTRQLSPSRRRCPAFCPCSRWVCPAHAQSRAEGSGGRRGEPLCRSCTCGCVWAQTPVVFSAHLLMDVLRVFFLPSLSDVCKLRIPVFEATRCYHTR